MELRELAINEMKKVKYNKVIVEAGKNGWFVKQTGKPCEIFVRWESLIKRLEEELTSK